MTIVAFTVHGVPAPAGSKRAFAHKHTGRIVVTDANKNSRSWKNQVSEEAAIAMTYHGRDGTSGYLPPLEGPLVLELVFVVPRPKGHYGARGNVRPSAPSHPTVKPDVLKLARAVEDALSGIVYRDDAQIVDERLVKVYGEPARVEVRVRQVEQLAIGDAA